MGLGTTQRAAGLPCNRLTIAIALAVVSLLAVCGSALATTGHTFTASFGGPGAEEGQFTGGPSGVGVGTAGVVFASDPGDSRIESFTAAGAFKAEFPINTAEFTSPGPLAVDSTVGGGVYVSVTNAETNAAEVVKYSAAGVFQYTLDASLSGTFLNYGQLAVAPSSGTVYVSATNSETFVPEIDSFDGKTGAFVAAFSGESGSPDGGFACPAALAADNAGHVFVLDPCKNRVDRYSGAGSYEATVDGGSRGAPQSLATDPETGDPYVVEAGASGLQVTYFSAAGASAPQTFAATAVGGLSGLAVGPDATVYAGDSANSVVDRFAPFEGPTVTTEAATEVEANAATLNGTLDAEGIASEYHYEYGLETSYGETTEAVDAGSGNTPEAAPATIAELVPNATYHYRLVGSNASGSIVGEDQTFTTAIAAPVVDGSPAFATPIASTEARVHATVNPENSPTTFHIEYGTTTAYGATAPVPDGEAGSAFADTAVAATLTGLQPATVYNFRVVAENSAGPQAGADATFVTAPAASATGTELTTKRAMLTGTIDPHGALTSYRFEYGTSTSYGAATEEASGGSGEGEQQVTEEITGLTPGTTYHVRVVATSNGVTRTGADGTFTTAPAPEASVTDPIDVTGSSATLQGAANTFGLSGTYHFEVVSLDGSYTANTSEQALSAAIGSQPVSVVDSSLPPGETFRVRLVVSSNEATGYSESDSFATAPLPPAGFPTPPSPASVYGCTAPKLNPYNGRVKPGSTITIGGSDLGLSGSVLLGENTLIPTAWSATGFTVEVPADATGTLGLTVNCGVASNTVAIATTAAPVNRFTITKRSVKGSTATIAVQLPGPGTLQSSSARTKSTSSRVAKAGAQTVKVTLSRAGAGALKKAKQGTLVVKVQLRFTPTGGSAGSQTATVTFKRKGGHR